MPGRRPTPTLACMEWCQRLIAVVDDEEPIRRALHRLLRSKGFNVETYTGGRGFIQSLSDHCPDCLVLDLHMPDMNGFEVLEHLQSLGLRIASIVVTGFDAPESQGRAFQADAYAFLHKPVDSQLLIDTIQSALSRGMSS